MLLVKSILSTAAQLARLGRGGGASGPAQKSSPTPTGASSPGSTPSDAMRQILADYDVADISPRALSEMLQKLRQAGALSEKDFQDLSSIRLDLDSESSGPDQRLNLVELYGKKLAAIRQQQDTSQTAVAARGASEATLQRQLGWLQKFAQIRAGTSPLGFDTLA